jgi:prepilin-type N-terminal cleavage/methylation domain-containing protein
MCRGFSLLELVFVLALMTLGVSLLLPAARRVDERLSVVAAREELVSLLIQARGRALIHGGAVVVLERSPPRAWITAGNVLEEPIDLKDLHGAELFISGGRPSAEFRFDGVGLGRMAARSMTLRRGGALARLVVSAYGRIRRE